MAAITASVSIGGQSRLYSLASALVGNLLSNGQLPSAHRRSPCDSMMEWLSPKSHASSLRLGFCGKRSLLSTSVMVPFHLSNHEDKGMMVKILFR